MKPYAVAVTIGSKVTGKEFDNESEFKAFLQKAEELKKKAPNLLVRIIRNGLPKPIIKSKALFAVVTDPEKEDCIAWKPLYKDGAPMVDDKSRQLYQSVPVRIKSPKVLYCPYCHSYKDWVKVDLGYGNTARGCECGMTENDFHIKTVNSLWKGSK